MYDEGQIQQNCKELQHSGSDDDFLLMCESKLKKGNILFLQQFSENEMQNQESQFATDQAAFCESCIGSSGSIVQDGQMRIYVTMEMNFSLCIIK